MCKVVGFTNSSKLDVVKASQLIGNELLKTERDGFGYAVQGQSNVFGEKSIADKFVSRIKSVDQVTLPIVEKRHESFGYFDKPVGPAIFHGRISTNDKGLLNCHPMQKNDWYLIHNGVVDDHGPEYAMQTTNDSEHVLHRLIQGIDQVELYLSGYYAFMAIDNLGRLHVARDSIASLYLAWCPEIQSYIFATTESLIEYITKELKIKRGPIDKVISNCYMIFESNELVHEQVIKPRGYDKRQADYADLSLGRKLDYDHDWREFYDDDSMQVDIETLMREIDQMDDTYTIEDSDGNILTVAQYKKLDQVSQLDCLIIRPDGTVIELADELAS